MGGGTPYDKIWDQHVVKTFENGASLLYIDQHLVQEVSSPQAFAGLRQAGRRLRTPEAHLAVADHSVPTKFREQLLPDGLASRQVSRLRQNADLFGIDYIPMRDGRHGIVHVIDPELGFTLPGATLAASARYSSPAAFRAVCFQSSFSRMTTCA